MRPQENASFRQVPPAYGDIKMPTVPSITSQTLPNGAVMHVLLGGSQPIVKVDVSLCAGPLVADRPLVGFASVNLLTEGTEAHTAKQIAETLDYYGASIWPSTNRWRATVSSLCLERDVRHIVGLLCEVIRRPAYQEDELELFKQQELQAFDVGELKSSTHASREYVNLLFEPGCVYSRLARRDDYKALTPQMLRAFHAKAYTANGMQIFVSGRPTDADVKFIADTFGSTDWAAGEAIDMSRPRYRPEPGKAMVEFDSEQTSVRMGRPLFGRDHEDFLAFQMVNAVFGGYFGSRLMQNLRERLGLTYGIYSGVSANRLGGSHTISAEVKTGSHEQVVSEVFKDMERLASECVSEREMETLRGFLMGDMLHFFDTVLTSADAIFGLLLDGQRPESLVELYDTMRDTSATEMRDMAAKWLAPSSYSVVCVGRGVNPA